MRPRDTRDPSDRCAAAAASNCAAGQRRKRVRGSVGQDGAELDDVIDRLAVPHAARAGRIVADHAADIRAAAGGHVGRELQSVPSRFGIEHVEHDARLDPRGLPVRIDFENTIQITAEIDDHARADRLPRQAGAAAAGNDRPTLRARPGDRLGHVGGRAGKHDGAGVDLIDASVGAVERAVVIVAVNFALEPLAEQVYRICGLCGVDIHHRNCCVLRRAVRPSREGADYT